MYTYTYSHICTCMLQTYIKEFFKYSLTYSIYTYTYVEIMFQITLSNLKWCQHVSNV